jgi:hypothetical protein
MVVVVSFHIHYTMPRVAMTSTLENLLDNLKHKFEVASKHVAFRLSQAWQFGQPYAHEHKHQQNFHCNGIHTVGQQC